MNLPKALHSLKYNENYNSFFVKVPSSLTSLYDKKRQYSLIPLGDLIFKKLHTDKQRGSNETKSGANVVQREIEMHKTCDTPKER